MRNAPCRPRRMQLPGTTSMTDQSHKPLVVGIGEILWDVLPSGRQLGGAPANFAWHAGALGARGLPVSCVGDDDDGREIIRRLRAMGMCCDYIFVDKAHPTGTVDVALDSSGVPTFVIHQNVAWDFIPFTDSLEQLAARAEAICFGSLAQRSPASRNTIRRFLEASRRQCVRVFDINLRQSFYSRQIIEDSLAAADVLKLNDQEMPVLMKLLDLDGGEQAAAQSLMHRYDLRLIALTRGGAGSRLYLNDGDPVEHPGYPTKVVDSVGAGDAFTAALTVGILRGLPPERIGHAANRLASYVCSQPGATPAVPQELADLLA